ncbi:MAG: hypothetical protein KTR31_32660 [Myxococcales bacterium]|nr:hypothetical protein [Myxococcales bacterium]
MWFAAILVPPVAQSAETCAVESWTSGFDAVSPGEVVGVALREGSGDCTDRVRLMPDGLGEVELELVEPSGAVGPSSPVFRRIPDSADAGEAVLLFDGPGAEVRIPITIDPDRATGTAPVVDVLRVEESEIEENDLTLAWEVSAPGATGWKIRWVAPDEAGQPTTIHWTDVPPAGFAGGTILLFHPEERPGGRCVTHQIYDPFHDPMGAVVEVCEEAAPAPSGGCHTAGELGSALGPFWVMWLLGRRRSRAT